MVKANDILTMLCDCDPIAEVKVIGAWKSNNYDFEDAKNINGILFENDKMIFKTYSDGKPVTAVNLIAFLRAFKGLDVLVECNLQYSREIVPIDGFFIASNIVYFCVNCPEERSENEETA